jgi:phospholipid/cholesterol/gamma-HCH transport system ATP-binding protein
MDDDASGIGADAETKALLDAAHEYSMHEGQPSFVEKNPGDFWSIECVDVYKSFGRKPILNGLNVGIPEGMITVILGRPALASPW